MSQPTLINTHITTFPPLPNYNIPLSPSTAVHDVYAALSSRIPGVPTTLRLSTINGRLLLPTSDAPISSYLTSTTSSLLQLRLTVPLCGGKGGFGSQLRAAGGRMSSRKKSQENSDSCRNLDGRRMRTVKEAKALAAYLEVKPEMEKAEKEKRLARWKKIVEDAERKGDDVEGEKKRFDDHAWIEMVEEDKERTREAVMRSLREGWTDRGRDAGEGSGSVARSASGGSSGAGSDAASDEEEVVKKTEMKRFAGWDEDDEFMSSDDEEMGDIQEEDEEDEEEEEEEEEVVGKGKGKAKA